MEIIAVNTVIDTAVFAGQFESGSEEWHAQRATGIGGSEIGTIAGLNKWQSAFNLWAKRTGKIPTEPLDSEAAEWGTRLEATIVDKFHEKHPEITLFRDPGSWQHVERPWQLANPDALYLNAAGELEVLECKTAQYEDDWDERSNRIPASYRAQVQWYLQVFGAKRAVVAVLFHGNKYREFEVLANQFEQDTYLHLATEFRKCLELDELPGWDGSTSTLDTVRQMNPEIEEGSEAELGDLGAEYFLAVADFAVAESRMTELKSRVLATMGNAKKGLILGEWVVTRRSRNGGAPYLENKKGK